MDYLTKPFDPWVLRAKVSVFVELWSVHARVAEQAAECARLRAAIDEAVEVLDAADGAEGADEVLDRVRERLKDVR